MLLNEGGNIFKDETGNPVTTRINQAAVDPTLQFVEKIKTDPEIPVVGERIKRSESNLFKFCYIVHKILTFIFTGKIINFGNINTK